MPKHSSVKSKAPGLVSQLLPLLLNVIGPVLSKRSTKSRSKSVPRMSRSRKSKSFKSSRSKKGVRRARVGGAFVNSNALAPRTARFATPASFAKIESNTTFISSERPVTHPSLGIAGVRFHGRQPLTAVAPNTRTNPTTPSSQFWTLEGPAAAWPPSGSGDVIQSYIDLSPTVLGFAGPLAVRASLYQRYRFLSIRICYTSACGTDQPGQGGMAIIEDPGAPQNTADTYQTLREVEPHVTFPYRVPEAQLNWVSRNTTLYYTFEVDALSPGPSAGATADDRQCKQGTLVGFDSGLLQEPSGSIKIPTLGYADIEYDIEFYDPVPPNSSISARTGAERELIKTVLAAHRGASNTIVGHSHPRCTISPDVLASVSDLVSSSSSVSCAPVLSPDPSFTDPPPVSSAPMSYVSFASLPPKTSQKSSRT